LLFQILLNFVPLQRGIENETRTFCFTNATTEGAEKGEGTTETIMVFGDDADDRRRAKRIVEDRIDQVGLYKCVVFLQRFSAPRCSMEAVHVECSLPISLKAPGYYNPLKLCKVMSWFLKPLLLSNGSTCTATTRRCATTAATAAAAAGGGAPRPGTTTAETTGATAAAGADARPRGAADTAAAAAAGQTSASISRRAAATARGGGLYEL
jgi:hypothetical protein